MRLIFMGTPGFRGAGATRRWRRRGTRSSRSTPGRRGPAGAGRERGEPGGARGAALGMVRYSGQPCASPAEQEAFAADGADAAVVVAYGLILPRAVLGGTARGCFNIHASLLPRWRGAAPIQRAVMAGDAETGVSIMAMEAGLDTGPVLLSGGADRGAPPRAACPTLAALGRGSWSRRCRARPALPAPQPEAGVTYAAKIDKAEARVDWARPAAEVDRLIRGLSPFPGAWSRSAASG